MLACILIGVEVLLDKALEALFEVIASGDILDKFLGLLRLVLGLGDLVGVCAGPKYRHLYGIVDTRAVICFGVWGLFVVDT
ncbi:20434_t:CDS:2, partial [Dentiscutata erythropus]